MLITISFTVFLCAQEASNKFYFNHLALSVKEVNRSAEFYATVLQLPEIVKRSKLEGIRWFTLADGKELHLISNIKKPVIINKALYVGLATNDMDAFVKKLVSLKIMRSDWPGKTNTVNIRTDGVKQIFFQDPDGYWVEVNDAK